MMQKRMQIDENEDPQTELWWKMGVCGKRDEEETTQARGQQGVVVSLQEA